MRFMGAIFPPHFCAHGPGEHPFEAFMCTVGLPLKSHACLQEISVFNTKYHLNLLRILLNKLLTKALHCCEILYYGSSKYYKFKKHSVLLHDSHSEDNVKAVFDYSMDDKTI